MDTTTALTTTDVLERKIESLLSQQTITMKDVDELNISERQYLGKAATAILSELYGTERDDFLEKIAPIVNGSTKNEMWEYNQTMISNAITDHTQKFGAMPTKTKIAQLTGLSRQTVAKHLQDYKQHQEFTEVTERLNLCRTGYCRAFLSLPLMAICVPPAFILKLLAR